MEISHIHNIQCIVKLILRNPTLVGKKLYNDDKRSTISDVFFGIYASTKTYLKITSIISKKILHM